MSVGVRMNVTIHSDVWRVQVQGATAIRSSKISMIAVEDSARITRVDEHKPVTHTYFIGRTMHDTFRPIKTDTCESLRATWRQSFAHKNRSIGRASSLLRNRTCTLL